MEIVMQRGLPQMPTDWDYGSISTLLSALHARKVSASELIEHTIARIEALDGRINAVIVRDFDRARDAASSFAISIAQGTPRAPPMPRLGAASGGHCSASP
jgi:Asp-tRNA(Asn)/Glu-tRNA(Gln) amidotransferase A subunit family amidase